MNQHSLDMAALECRTCEQARIIEEVERRQRHVDASLSHGERGSRMHDFYCWMCGVEFATGQTFAVEFSATWQPPALPSRGDLGYP